MASSTLNAVNSNGVRRDVIRKVEYFRKCQEDQATDGNPPRFWLTVDMPAGARDAEYIVECLLVLLRQERIAAERGGLYLDHDGISDAAIDVFAGFLRETPCLLHSLLLESLPPRQVRRLLEALHNNRSVKNLITGNIKEIEGISRIANLLRHKKDLQDCFCSTATFRLRQFCHCWTTKLESVGIGSMLK